MSIFVPVPGTLSPSQRFMSMVQYYAQRTGLPPELVWNQMMQESGGNPDAESPVGAVGLLQLMPATAAEMGCTDRKNPDKNLRAGTEYLARQKAAVQLLLHGQQVADEDILRFALASYNAGYGYVRVAIKKALELGSPLTWETIASLLPKAEVRGRTADVKQVTGYVQRILP